MASQQSVVVLSPQADLCPSPLHIRKKTRRTTFYRRITRKSTSRRPPYGITCGPLDDIINEITGDIWGAPFECDSGALLRECESTSEALLTWQHPLKAPSTCTVTALPVSRIPSDQPLTIRKNRNSRSTGSGSSTDFPMPSSRKTSRAQPAPAQNIPVILPADELNSPWPSFEGLRTDLSGISTASILCTDYTGAQKALQGVRRSDSSTQSDELRPSRLRLFTNNFPRLRRAGTGDTTGSNASAKSSSPVDSLGNQIEEVTNSLSGLEDHPSDAAVEALAFMQKHARNGSMVGSVITRAAERLPSSFENRCEQDEAVTTSDPESTPSTLKASVRIMPEVKLLRTAEDQDLRVGIEVAGVAHNRHVSVDSSMDVIFVIDNSYYVSKDCLGRALNTVLSALYHLSRGDRVALYTTHCTHNVVSGTVPDMILPLRSFCTETEETLRELINDIGACGTQTLEPPRPNPTMSDVVLAVAKSLENKDISQNRTHMIILTPTTNVLHAISQTFPRLYIHQMSPGVLPFRHSEELQDRICEEPCCENVFVSNWAHYQSPSSRIKQIIRDARSEKPLGKITNVHVEIRTKKGCEVVEIEGTSEIGRLRLGQVHSFFVRVHITRSETQELDLEMIDPVLHSSLGETLRQDLRNAQAIGATSVHLLTVQVVHQNSLQPPNCWNYTESQLVVTKDLGGLASPINLPLELYKRQFFHRFSRHDANADSAQPELEILAVATPDTYEELKQLAQRMSKEIRCHKAILEYEMAYRQKLPIRPGPICLDVAHDWLAEKWDEKRNKRKGLAII